MKVRYRLPEHNTLYDVSGGDIVCLSKMLAEHNATLESVREESLVFELNFETEEDLIIFRLKFGV